MFVSLTLLILPSTSASASQWCFLSCLVVHHQPRPCPGSRLCVCLENACFIHVDIEGDLQSILRHDWPSPTSDHLACSLDIDSVYRASPSFDRPMQYVYVIGSHGHVLTICSARSNAPDWIYIRHLTIPSASSCTVLPAPRYRSVSTPCAFVCGLFPNRFILTCSFLILFFWIQKAWDAKWHLAARR